MRTHPDRFGASWASSHARPKWGVCLDKAYDHQFIRDELAAVGFTPHLGSRGEEARELRKETGERARRLRLRVNAHVAEADAA